ncbi:uncharacterized protein PGTG_02272 [Puccinia graminis f. sp. tritici CRL 75-36-700-3]|uniref:Uncharacterized protein n=1 Tax=Puccinia graminis f. sp. tritici (strain CRL 75-36-700-3 / race SCCL) TaxID=418459 RepID=E3JXN6_PUCGT|nr:uncharacterized protein PGTG_02272 [Puccinia graminis f. sp. tritici CRL 75-36-700-3]EFP76811.1 hypothetical protein PGTG_02272 [Puccinia graminis f. sp. tritici CRL 75-36-700-3]
MVKGFLQWMIEGWRVELKSWPDSGMSSDFKLDETIGTRSTRKLGLKRDAIVVEGTLPTRYDSCCTEIGPRVDRGTHRIFSFASWTGSLLQVSGEVSSVLIRVALRSKA